MTHRTWCQLGRGNSSRNPSIKMISMDHTSEVAKVVTAAMVKIKSEAMKNNTRIKWVLRMICKDTDEEKTLSSWNKFTSSMETSILKCRVV